MNNLSILVVEDDVEIAEILTLYLDAAGFDTKVFHTGEGVVEWVKSTPPNLVILDIDLPVKSGFSICEEIRVFSQLPIIMTTAKVEEVDRLIGLEIGADDYVCKPYSVKEVVARVKANLRRFIQDEPVANELLLNKDSFKVSYLQTTIELTTVEFSLFKLLYDNGNRIYSRAQIMDLVYHDYRDISDRTVDSHIRNLRKKLAKLPIEQELIRSIYGAGYKYEPI